MSALYWDRLGSALVRTVNVGGLSIAGVGMLATMTAPLPLALLAYHVYLIWAGMTTNESQKWSDWKEDMADGYVFRGKRSAVVARDRERKAQQVRARAANGHAAEQLGKVEEEEEEEPEVDWPVGSDQVVVRTTDGRPPTGREHLYEQIWSLNQVENIYDLGFSDNLLYVLQGK